MTYHGFPTISRSWVVRKLAYPIAVQLLHKEELANGLHHPANAAHFCKTRCVADPLKLAKERAGKPKDADKP